MKLYKILYIAAVIGSSPLMGMGKLTLPDVNPKSLDTRFKDPAEILSIFPLTTAAERLQQKLLWQRIVQFLHAQHEVMLEADCYCNFIQQWISLHDQNSVRGKVRVDSEKYGMPMDSIGLIFTNPTPEQFSLMLYLAHAIKNNTAHQEIIETITPFLKTDDASLKSAVLTALMTLIGDLRDANNHRFLIHLGQVENFITENKTLAPITASGYTYFIITLSEEYKRYRRIVQKEMADETFSDEITDTDREHFAVLRELLAWHHAQLPHLKTLYSEAFKKLSKTTIASFLNETQFLTSTSLDQMTIAPEAPKKMSLCIFSSRPIFEEPLSTVTVVQPAPEAHRKDFSKRKKPHHKRFSFLDASASADASTREEGCEETLQAPDDGTLTNSDEACDSTFSTETTALESTWSAPSCAASSSSSSAMPHVRKSRKKTSPRILNTKDWWYDLHVTEWHTDPDAALKFHGDLAGNPTEEERQEIIIRHRLPYVLEDRFQQLAITKNSHRKNNKTGVFEKEVELNFPGAMKFPDKKLHYGIFSIAINPENNHVYHRFFHTTPTQKLAKQLQHCIAQLEIVSTDTGTDFIQQPDLTDSACTIEESALTVRITDSHGIVYILFKGHMIE